jgi:hypothetical protein
MSTKTPFMKIHLADGSVMDIDLESTGAAEDRQAVLDMIENTISQLGENAVGMHIGYVVIPTESSEVLQEANPD